MTAIPYDFAAAAGGTVVTFRDHTADELAHPEADPTVCIVEGCGGAYAFDPLLEGETCGGNMLVGWLVCDRCGGIFADERRVA